MLQAVALAVRLPASLAARVAATGLRSLPVTRYPSAAGPSAWVPMPQAQSSASYATDTRLPESTVPPMSAGSTAACRAMLASQSAWMRSYSAARSS